MKISSGIALLLFLISIIAIFQLVQNRHAFPLRAAASPSATSFLAAASTATPATTALPTDTPTLTPTLVLSSTPTLSPTISVATPTFSPTLTPTTTILPFLAPGEPPIVVMEDENGACPTITHHDAFVLPTDKQNDRAWISTAIFDYMNGGGDPYRIVDAFRLLERDAFVRFADLEQDGIKELLIQITIFPSEGRRSYLGFLDCANGQVAQLSWFAETDMKYGEVSLVDVTDLDGDGIKEMIGVSERATDDVGNECQIKVMIYWANLQRPEALEDAFPSRDNCSFAVQVTIEKHILVYNSHFQPTEVALYQWDTNLQRVRLIGIEPTSVSHPIVPPSSPPNFPVPLVTTPQGAPHCPPIQPIEDFWLVPTVPEFTTSLQMILDFDDEEKGVIPQILAYLNAGGDPDELFLALAREHKASDLRKADLNGDGVNEVLIKIHDGSYQGTNRIGLFFCTSQGTYELEKWLIRGTDFGYGYSDIVAIEDFNQDGYPEVLIEDIPLMSSCYRKRHLLGWNGTELTPYFIDDGGNECDTTLTVSDLDNDGYKEWVIRGNDDRFRWDWRRDATWVYKLKPIAEIDPLLQQDRSYYEKLPDDGLVYVLESKVLDAPTDKVHILEDAHTALQSGDRQQAIYLYEQAITDPALSFQEEINDPSEAFLLSSEEEREKYRQYYMTGEAYTLGFAYLRLIILYTADGNIAQAEMWFQAMNAGLPDSGIGGELRSVAQTFMTEWQNSQNISLVCSTINAQYDQFHEQDTTQWRLKILYLTIGQDAICPFVG